MKRTWGEMSRGEMSSGWNVMQPSPRTQTQIELHLIWVWKQNTEAKRNFATHFDLSVKIKDKVYTSKVLRHIWTLIGYMIDTIRKTAPDVYQKVARKIELRQVLCRVSNTRKVDWSRCLFGFSTFNNAKMNNRCPKKSYI